MSILVQSLSIFFTILEALLLLDLFCSMLRIQGLRKPLDFMLNPILAPVRTMMSHSVFHSPMTDISPIIAFIVLTYLGELVTKL